MNVDVLAIGCGGLLWHGTSGIVCELRMLAGEDGAISSAFMDDDVIEARNMERQAWPGVQGETKADLARRVFWMLAGNTQLYSQHIVARLERERQIVDWFNIKDCRCRIVIALPDNDLGRKVAAVGARMLSERGCAVWYVTAGNTNLGGQAWGAVAEDGVWKDTKSVGQWDIWRSREDRPPARGCGDDQMQSLPSNMITAALLGNVMRDLRGGADITEWYWMKPEEGPIKLWKEK